MKLTIKKKIGAATASVAVVAGAGIASAYWTSTGDGAGGASTGTSSPWAVTSGTNSTLVHPVLTPGGPTDVVDFHVKNNSTGNQRLASVAISVANPDGTPWTSVAGCSAADFSVGGAAAGATYVHTANDDLAAGTSHNATVSLQMVNRNVSQDGCKLASVPLYLSAS